MIIDSHHHLWKYLQAEYGWINDTMKILKKDYLPSDLEPLLTQSGVEGTVVVQARQTMEETHWLLENASDTPYILGVVGWFNLMSENLGDTLQSLKGRNALVGARHVLQDEPDDLYMLQPGFLEGVALLQSFGLSYDLLLLPRHLPVACRLVSLFPDMRFILDHLSKPSIARGKMHPWKEEIQALARYPNVRCKVSGMVTEADTERWKYEDFIPYLDTVFDAFGTERVMIGSDWPVCLLAGDYSTVMDIPQRYMEGKSNAEKERVFFMNAVESYQLDFLT